MTYRDLVDKFRLACDEHLIIRDFGYGALSDMKTVNTETNELRGIDTPYYDSTTNYPYVFLNPTQSTRTTQAITYRFNMIVMDVALERELTTTSTDEEPRDAVYDPYLQVQSDCQQYIDDIIAYLRFADYDDKSDLDIQLSVNLTPFKERFQDTVAGMTATIEVMVAQPINNCIAPTE